MSSPVPPLQLKNSSDAAAPARRRRSVDIVHTSTKENVSGQAALNGVLDSDSDNMGFINSLSARGADTKTNTTAKMASPHKTSPSGKGKEISRPGPKNTYYTATSERAAAKRSGPHKLASYVRAQQTHSPREPYQYPQPVSFRRHDLGTGREEFLPAYDMLKQVSADVADSPRGAGSRGRARARSASGAMVDHHSSSAISDVAPGVLDVRNKKLGDEYGYVLIREAMAVLCSTAAAAESSSNRNSGISPRGGGGGGVSDADAGAKGPNISSMLSGLSRKNSTSLHPEDDEEAYFDLSKPHVTNSESKPHPLKAVVLKDNRLTDSGLIAIMQCMQGKNLGVSTAAIPSMSASASVVGNGANRGASTTTVSGTGAKAARQVSSHRRNPRSAKSALSTLDTLDFSENSLRRKGALELSQLLELCANLRVLSLEKTGINDTALRALILADPGVGSIADGSRSLAMSARNNPPVHVGGHSVGDAMAPATGSALEENSIVGSMANNGGIFFTPGEQIPTLGLLNIAVIDLNSNHIGDSGCVPLATLIRCSTALRELNLSWNEIKDKGGMCLAAAIADNATIQKLDLSWNALGTKTEVKRMVAVAIADMLARNSSLIHMDLSQNQLTPADCELISTGLAANHSLLGLHMTGNGGSLDAYGHLVPDAQPWPLESGHVMTRIIGENFQTKKRKKLLHQSQAESHTQDNSSCSSSSSSNSSGKWQLRNNCWICGCYRETEFNYTLTQKSIEVILREHDNEQKSVGSFAAAVDKATVEESGNAGAEKNKPPRRTELPKAYTKAISVKLVTSFDKWIPEEMNPAENIGSEQYKHEKNSSDHANLDLHHNRIHATNEDQKACLLAATSYAFDSEEAAKEVKEAAAARSAAADRDAIREQSLDTKASEGKVKGKNAKDTKKNPKAPAGPAPKGKEKDKKRHKGRKTVEPKRDPNVALITKDQFQAKLATLQANMASMAGAGNIIGTGGGSGDNSDMATQEHISNSFTHEAQEWIHAKEDKNQYDYGIDADDELYAYFGGNTSPPMPKVDPDSTEAMMATLMGSKKSVRKTMKAQALLGNLPRPKYSLHRMVPPGVHYYALSVNGGSLTFDPFSPHVSTASLIEMGMYVPRNVKLPAYLNKLGVDAPTEAERMAGMESLFTPLMKPRDKNTDAAKELKMWTFKDSLFYGATHKHEASYIGRCFFKDWAYTKASKGKVPADVEAIEKTLRAHYTLICAIFTHYAGLYATEMYFMSMGAFNEFVQKIRAIDGEQGRRKTVVIKKENIDVEAASLVENSVVTAGSDAAAEPSLLEEDSVVSGKSRATMLWHGAGESDKEPNPMNGTCTRTEVELIFVSACITGPRHEYNSKRALCRFQFLDCLVNIANVKYVKSKQCSTIESALKKLLSECIDPMAEREKPPLMTKDAEGDDDDDDESSDDDDDDPYNMLGGGASDKPNALKGRLIGEPFTPAGNGFRKRFLYTKECDAMLRRHLPKLQAIFKKFSGEENTPLEEKTMCFKEWLGFTDAAGLANDFLAERMTKLTYIRSKCFYDDCFDESNEFKKMTFLEFLECIVRCAYTMHLEKQLFTASNLDTGGSGMGKSASNASLMRQGSGSLSPTPSRKALAAEALAAASVAGDGKLNQAALDDMLAGAVSGVSDFLSTIELIAKKRVL